MVAVSIVSSSFFQRKDEMILSVSIVRVHDGLALCASTDLDRGVDMKECQQYMKLLSRKASTLPDRCTLSLDGYSIQ